MVPALAVSALLGLASTLHCWGMCGGILAAFSLGIPAERRSAGSRLVLITCFNAGRVCAYGVAGAIAGAAGSVLLAFPGREYLFVLLQIMAAVVIALAALRLGGWTRSDGLLERLGAGLWMRVQPLFRHLLPVDRASRALALGALWGWIPCGMVYAALALSASRADPVEGALGMLAFGAGTLPGMIGAGTAGGALGSRFQATTWRRSMAVMLLLLGFAGPLATWYWGRGHEAHVHGATDGAAATHDPHAGHGEHMGH